jgi:hypothetical protein
VSITRLQVLYVVYNLPWLIIGAVLCRKSTNLSWESEEPSAAAGEEDQSAGMEESAVLPQTEAVTQFTEAMP